MRKTDTEFETLIMSDGKKYSGILSIGEQAIQQNKKKMAQARNKRIKISIALEENETDEKKKMTDGQEISFQDIRKGHRHAVSKCQGGEAWRR